VSAEQGGTRNRNTTAVVDYGWVLQALLHLFFSAFRTRLKSARRLSKHAHQYFYLVENKALVWKDGKIKRAAVDLLFTCTADLEVTRDIHKPRDQ